VTNIMMEITDVSVEVESAAICQILFWYVVTAVRFIPKSYCMSTPHNPKNTCGLFLWLKKKRFFMHVCKSVWC